MISPNRRAAIAGMIRLVAVRLVDLANRLDRTDPIAAAYGVDTFGWQSAATYLAEREPPADFERRSW